MDEDETTTEDEAIDEEAREDDEAGEPAEEREHHGLSFRLGLFLGAIAGGVGATMLAPSTGERSSDSDGAISSIADEADASVDRVRSVLDTVRSRVQEAADQAKDAAQAAEEESRKRFAELTDAEQKTD